MRLILTLILLCACVFCSVRAAAIEPASASVLQRQRRQFDFRVSAEHDDKDEETELALEAIAGLWRSPDGNTQVEGSAKVVHRSSNTLQQGNTRYKAELHVRHEYKRRK